ncbi:MAG: nitroreductase family protein [Succinivibrio dextrinosolvens]|nr:nitroreductase family protein [Succinivibrio dextrinosolvens]MDY6420910.1 nitroreductase family protein [Succinivibrio dextrinosolvens]MDY6469989.1 nitroreductase family protein [Succinivibrio dextrinosolvens]
MIIANGLGEICMDAIENILSRKSVREFSNKEISEQDLKTILTAGMSGPSALNMRPYDFIVIRKKDLMEQIYDENGIYYAPLKQANVGVIVCGDIDKAYLAKNGYWIIDSTIAAQNIILAANALGIGSVWLGAYPEKQKYLALQKLFSLSNHVIPVAVIALGYPLDDKREIRDLYEEEKIHKDKW